MSNIFSNPSNNAAIQAIEDAIGNASDEICPQVDLENFDPWAKGDPLTQSSHDFCGQLFDDEVAKMDHRILNNQDMPDVISYSGTRGWLYGYSCAQKKASLVISNKNTEISTKNAEINRLNQELGNTQNNLTQKTKEANKLEVKLESKTDQYNKLNSTDKGKLYRKLQWAKYCCLGLVAALAVAIIIIIIN